jgi:BON domain
MSQVRPPPDETTEYLLERIRAALAHDPRLGELELSVCLVEDRVVVTGTVQTEDRRRAVADVLAGVVPERRVENLTKVLDTTKQVVPAPETNSEPER